MQSDELSLEEKKSIEDEVNKALKSTTWRKAVDPRSNKAYYYNRQTKQTQWNPPNEIVELESKLKAEILSKREPKAAGAPKEEILHTADHHLPNARNGGDNNNSSDPLSGKVNMESTSEKEKGYESDDSNRTEPFPDNVATAASSSSSTNSHNQQQAKAMDVDVEESATTSATSAATDKQEGNAEEELRLNETLSSKDSILDRDAITNSQKLIRIYKKSPAFIVEKLSGSYCGYPQMCRIMLDVLSFAQALEGSSQRPGVSSSSSAASTTAAEMVVDGSNFPQSDAEQIILDHYSGMIQQRFNKRQADEILLQYDHVPTWIKGMMNSERLRKLLTDLTQQHRDSSFLRFCSKEMSVLGYGNKHSPLVIAADFEGVGRFYILLTEIVLKSLAGEESAAWAAVDELAILVRPDKELLNLLKFECQRLREVIFERDPALKVDNSLDGPEAKRARVESPSQPSSSSQSSHLQAVLNSLDRLESASKKHVSISRRPLDTTSLSKRLQEDSLLQSLVTVTETEDCSEEDLKMFSRSLGCEEDSLNWQCIRHYWSSPHLTYVLLDLYLKGQSGILAVIARAVMISDLLPQFLDGLCSLSIFPKSRKEAQDALEGVYEFCHWRETVIEDVYGTIDRQKIQDLLQLVGSRRVFAQGFLRWLHFYYSVENHNGKAEDQSISDGTVISFWAQALKVIVEKFPLFGSDVAKCVEMLLGVLASAAESDDLAMQSARLFNNASAKKELLAVLIDVLHGGFVVEETCRYLMANVDSFDAVGTRQVFYQFLVDMKPALWLTHFAIFLELLSLPRGKEADQINPLLGVYSVMKAVTNVHFNKEGIENLRRLVAATDDSVHVPANAVRQWADLKKMLNDLP
eukprot:scaffold2208_cov170-Ochromonas_danica.AAC.20